MAQDRIPTGTIFSALSGYWIRKHRVPLVTIILVLGLGFSALLFLPAGGEGENEDNVLKKYLSGRKKPSSKAANYKAPEETEGGDLATWLKKKLPEKIRAELASFKVKEDEKPPEGMDPDLWEMERMTVLKKGTTALHRKNYQEAITLYRQGLSERGTNTFVKAYAWGGIMEAHMQSGNKAGFEQALGEYSETLHELGYAKPGKDGFNPLMMYKRMQSFGSQIDDFNQKIDNVASDKEIPAPLFKQKLQELNETFVGLCESVEKKQEN